MPIEAHSFELVRENEELVKEALNSGNLDQIIGTQLTVADGYVLCAMVDDFWKDWVREFPDYRQEPEVSGEVLLVGGLSAGFRGFLSQSGVAFALRSRSVLEKLGYGVSVLEAGEGISRRGTQHPLAFSVDTVRKYLEVHEIREPKRIPPKGDEHPEDLQFGYDFVHWYNSWVGPSLRNRYGRVVHSFDGTDLPVCFENENYEGSGVKRKDDELTRGYKLGLLKSYLDDAEVISAMELGPIQRHDVVLGRRLLLSTSVLKAGDMLVYDRGLICPMLLSDLKEVRGVDVIVPIREDMHLMKDAVAFADMLRSEAKHRGQSIWTPHPFREEEHIVLLKDLKESWDDCHVQINGALVRYKNKEGELEYVLFVCTDLKLTAVQILRTYQLRVEIEEDNRQLKRSWEILGFTSTSLVYILFHIVLTLAAYTLFVYYNGTREGRQFSKRTIQKAKREEEDDKNIRVILVAWGYFVILRPVELVLWILDVPEEAKKKLKGIIEPWVRDTSDLWPFEFR